MSLRPPGVFLSSRQHPGITDRVDSKNFCKQENAQDFQSVERLHSHTPDVRGLNAKAIDTLDAFLNPDISIPQHWVFGSEQILPSKVEITDPVQLSKRPARTRLDRRAMGRSW